MKLVIEQDGVKRLLEGAFSLCLSRDDARHLSQQLQQCCGPDFTYGWVSVAANMRRTPNTAPMPWAFSERPSPTEEEMEG